MVDCTLNAMFEDRKYATQKTEDASIDLVKVVTADTRARIEKAFSRQGKVSARLREPIAAQL
jgi:hypothetical protein